MKFDRGYISPYFVTDAKTQMCEMENPIILIVEKKVRRGMRQPVYIGVVVSLCGVCALCGRKTPVIV